MYGMHHEIRNFVQAIKQGKLVTRGNDWDFEGKWRELIGGLNEVIDTFMTPFEVAATYLSRISRGDIPEPIKGAYKGGFNEIRRSLNTLIAAVNILVADVDQLCSAAVLGQLSTRVDTSGHGGDFRKIVEGFNETMDAVIGPLSRSAVVLGKVARGDLTAELEGRYEGDFARLQRDLNQMVRNLRASMLQIAETAEALAVASSRFEAISAQLTANADGASARAGEATAAGRSVAQSIEAVAAGSEDISTSIHGIAEEAGDAARLSTTTAAAADSAGKSIRKLETSSRAIGEVIQAIGSITEQTRTLAQHAGRQASKAAETGRGFGVVADEVKRLAQRTREAAGDIGGKVGGLEAAAARVAAGTAQSGTASQLTESSRQIGKDLQTISSLGLQTHMLSLNASIEAARAEEAGRQFALVAQSVEELSSGTSRAAADIGGQLEAIRADSDVVVSVIGDITGMVHRIDSGSSAIAGAVENQAATAAHMQENLTEAAQAIRDVVESMTSVAAAARGTAALAGETRAAAVSLNAMAEKLRALVAEFRCDHAASSPGSTASPAAPETAPAAVRR